MNKKLRYALIGCGGCGVRKHLASYARYPDDVELYGVYDFDAQLANAAAEEFAVPHQYAHYEDLLADRHIDIVSVATANFLHAPITIAALKAGKHVHVEKPIALNAAQAQAIAAEERLSGKKVMVALNNRFSETSRFAKQYVDDGHLGEIYHARCGWRRRNNFIRPGRWFSIKEYSGGGPLIDLGVHFFDLTLHLTGFPVPVAVSASTYNKFVGELHDATTGKPLFDVEDIAVGFAKFDTGLSVAFEFSWGSHIEQEVNYFELLGSRGGMSMYNGELKIFSTLQGEMVDIVPKVANVTKWGETETRHFIDCIREDRPPLSPSDDAVKMMQIIDAIYASAASGREVRISATDAPTTAA